MFLSSQKAGGSETMSALPGTASLASCLQAPFIHKARHRSMQSDCSCGVVSGVGRPRTGIDTADGQECRQNLWTAAGPLSRYGRFDSVTMSNLRLGAASSHWTVWAPQRE